jgi:hypothetical protein
LPQRDKGRARELAGEAVGVSARYVSDAKAIEKKAPDLFEQLGAGAITLPEAKRRVQRQERIEGLAKRAIEYPTGPFQILYADPPWQYEHVASNNRTIANQYPTLTLAEINAQPPTGWSPARPLPPRARCPVAVP